MTTPAGDADLLALCTYLRVLQARWQRLWDAASGSPDSDGPADLILDAPPSGCCLGLSKQACGCDVGTCGFAIDVALGFSDFGSTLAGGDLARVDVAGQAEQVLGALVHLAVEGREEALVHFDDVNDGMDALSFLWS